MYLVTLLVPSRVFCSECWQSTDVGDLMFIQKRDPLWQLKDGRDRWFCFLVERKVTEAILKGWSWCRADNLAPEFGPPLGRCSRVFQKLGWCDEATKPQPDSYWTVKTTAVTMGQRREETFNSQPRHQPWGLTSEEQAQGLAHKLFYLVKSWESW